MQSCQPCDRESRDCIELEFEANLVRTFRIDLIPGLFQTPDYILASARAEGRYTDSLELIAEVASGL